MIFQKNKSYAFSVDKYIAWAKKNNVREFIMELKLDMVADGTEVQVESPTFGYCKRKDFNDKKTEIMPIWCNELK